MRDLIIKRIFACRTDETRRPNGMFGKNGRYAKKTKKDFELLSDVQLLVEFEYILLNWFKKS